MFEESKNSQKQDKYRIVICALKSGKSSKDSKQTESRNKIKQIEYKYFEESFS